MIVLEKNEECKKSVCEIRKGDLVLTFDGKEKVFSKVIENKLNEGIFEFYEIQLKNGSNICNKCVENAEKNSTGICNCNYDSAVFGCNCNIPAPLKHKLSAVPNQSRKLITSFPR